MSGFVFLSKDSYVSEPGGRKHELHDKGGRWGTGDEKKESSWLD